MKQSDKKELKFITKGFILMFILISLLCAWMYFSFEIVKAINASYGENNGTQKNTASENRALPGR